MCNQQLFYAVFKTQDTREIIFKHQEIFVEDEKINDCADIMVHVYSKIYKFTDDEIRDTINKLVFGYSETQFCGYNSPLDLKMINYCNEKSIPMEVNTSRHNKDCFDYTIAMYYLKLLKRKELKKLFKAYLIHYLKYERDIEQAQEDYFRERDFYYRCHVCGRDDEGTHLDTYDDIMEFEGFVCHLHFCWECHYERTYKFMKSINEKHHKKLSSYKVKKY